MVNYVQDNLTRQLKAIPKKDFAGCFETWKSCWDKCVKFKGSVSKGLRPTVLDNQIFTKYHMAGYFPDTGPD